MDADGCPEEHELERIRNWDPRDWRAMLEYVRELWRYTSAWDEGDYYLSLRTSGWRGNEMLVEALQGNTVFWAVAWESSQRGGHHMLDLSRIPEVGA